MTTVSTQSQYIEALQHFKQESGAKYGITRIGVFGSVARGEHTAESDVDVVLEAPVMDLFSLIGIKQELEKTLNAPVDVVLKTEYMPPRFKARIEREVMYV